MNRRVFGFAVFAAFAFLVVIGSAQQKRPQDVELQAAIRTETVGGDLNGAIKQYGAIVSKYKTDRVVTATALVHMAECYQKLGDAQAKKLFEQVLRNYADQTEAVTIARARLGGRQTTGTGMVARQLWTTTGYAQVTIASDGRSAAVTEPSSPDVQLRDLTTGQSTRLKVTSDPASDAYAEWPVLSPDLKRVAYAYAGPETKWDYQVRIAETQPDARPRPLGNVQSYLYINGWAPDGKSVLLTAIPEGNSAQIAWMSVADGTTRILKSLEWQDARRTALSPDGKFIAYDVRVEPGKQEREIRILASDGSSESVVVHAPGINASPVWSRDGSTLAFKSDRSGTFGIWSVPVRNGRVDGAPARLKADVGDIALIGFTASGSLLYDHTVGASEIFAMDLDSQTGKLRGDPARLVDTFLGWNWNPASSPDGKSLAYLSRRNGPTSGSATLVIRSLETGAERVIPTPFRVGAGGGVPVWLSDGQTLIHPGRNSQNHTTLYKVDLKSGDVAVLVNTGTMSPTATAISPDGRTAYTVTVVDDHTVVNAFELGSGGRTEVSFPGDVKSVATSPDGRSIAFRSWTNGSPTTSRLHIADANGGNPRAILTSDKPSELVATVKWSPDGRFIYFVYRGQGSLWRIAATGGTPSLVGELAKNPVRTFEVTRDGRRVIFGSDKRATVDIWALENVLPKATTASR